MDDSTPILDAFDDTMLRLAAVRPVFHAEADFQHALVWQIREDHPDAQVRLETRPLPDESKFLDILVTLDDKRLAIECKYLVKGLRVSVADEAFHLRNQSAHDIRRYDSMKDIARIEYFIRAGAADVGVAIVLTNDGPIWRPSKRSDTNDAMFRLTEGRTVTGELTWGPDTSPGSMMNREDPIVLAGMYEFHWCDYSTLAEGSSGQFRYLAVPIRSLAQRSTTDPGSRRGSP